MIDVQALSADPLEALRELTRAGAELEEIARQQVVEARRRGATWEQIGESLGMSRQAAWEYYTRDVRRVLEETASANDDLSDEDALRMASEEVDEIRRRRRRRSDG